jgi:hypothetical protein
MLSAARSTQTLENATAATNKRVIIALPGIPIFDSLLLISIYLPGHSLAARRSPGMPWRLGHVIVRAWCADAE